MRKNLNETMKVNSDITLDKLNTKDVKSNEQLRQHSIDQQLENKPIERALHLISLGEEVQKLSVIQGIPELLVEDRTGCLQKILPKMQQALINGSTELHMTASLAVRAIIEEKVLPVDMFIPNFLHTIKQAIDNRDSAVANSWSETLLEAIKILPNNVIQHEITPIAIARAQMGKPVPVRISSCRLLGELATKYEPQMLKKDLIPTVISLCQDVNGEVRAEMAKQLMKIAAQLGPELTRTNITQPLIELSSDEDTLVKENAFATIVETLPYFGPESMKTAILPLIKQMIVLAFKLEDSLLITISKMFGKMCLGIQKHLNEADKELYVKWYITMAIIGVSQSKKEMKFDRRLEDHTHDAAETSSSHRNIMCRQNCANNYALLARFSQDVTKRGPPDILHNTLKLVVGDPCYIVRREIASNFNQICAVYLRNCHLLKDEFIQLCRDDAVDVLAAFVPNLSFIMEIFLRQNVFRADASDEVLPLLMRALVKTESTLARGYKWRYYLTFVQQTRNFYKFIPSDILYASLMMCCLKIVNSSRMVPVRIAALKNLLIYMKYTNRVQHRKEIKDKIISDDPVPNIRCSLIKFLPNFKAMLKLPADARLATLLDTSLAKLAEDKDKETKKTFLSYKDAIAEADSAKLFPDDAKKVEEEKKILASERKEPTPQRGRPVRPTTTQRRRPSLPNVEDSSKTRPTTSPASVPSVRQTRPPVQRVGGSVDKTRSTEMSGQEKEFFVDAGIQLPDSMQEPPNKSQTTNNNNSSNMSDNDNSNNNNNNHNINNHHNNNNNTPLKRWENSPRIPVRRPTRQRHSLEVTDFNKNITSMVSQEKSIPRVTTTSQQFRSHLPRPLSCINFHTTSAAPFKCEPPISTSKQRHISKLPVVNRSLSETSKNVRR